MDFLTIVHILACGKNGHFVEGYPFQMDCRNFINANKHIHIMGTVLRKSVRNIMKIYFVCTGNTCRSPMAEAILKHKKSTFEVKSAGIYALEGGRISENSKIVLENENIHFNHTTRQVKKEDIEWADLILTMTTAHRDMILQLFKEAEGKTYTLKEYVAPYSSLDVSDPYGGDIHTYTQTYEELNRLIDDLINKITKGEEDDEQEL